MSFSDGLDENAIGILPAFVVVPTNEKQHARSLLILSCLYYMYLRVSELTASEHWQPMMKHFYQDSQKRWWFKTVGKGNKDRNIAVSEEMLQALKSYRVHRKLSPVLPTVNDNAPLLHSLRGDENIASKSVVQKSVQACFDQTIEVLKKQHKEDSKNALFYVKIILLNFMCRLCANNRQRALV